MNDVYGVSCLNSTSYKLSRISSPNMHQQKRSPAMLAVLERRRIRLKKEEAENRERQINEPPLMIAWRQFSLDVTAGELSIEDRPLIINEKSNTGEGTGLVVWDGAILLSKVLEHMLGRNGLRGKRVLELGCGTGVVGLSAAALGAQSVHLTDLHYTLHNTRENARKNSHLFARHECDQGTGHIYSNGRENGRISVDCGENASSNRCGNEPVYSTGEINVPVTGTNDDAERMFVNNENKSNITVINNDTEYVSNIELPNTRLPLTRDDVAAEYEERKLREHEEKDKVIENATGGTVHVRELDWFDESPVLHADDRLGWHWIVAADVAWVDELVEPLVRTLVRTAKGPYMNETVGDAGSSNGNIGVCNSNEYISGGGFGPSHDDNGCMGIVGGNTAGAFNGHIDIDDNGYIGVSSNGSIERGGDRSLNNNIEGKSVAAAASATRRLPPPARVLLAHQTRSLRTDELLFGLLKEHFEIRRLRSEEYHPEFVPNDNNVLAVYMLTLRNESGGD